MIAPGGQDAPRKHTNPNLPVKSAAWEAHKFKPGQSGNPGGKPKGTTITAAIRHKLSLKVRQLFDREQIKKLGGPKGRRLMSMEVAEAIAEVVVKEALNGNFQFLRELMDRTEGTVAQRLAGHDGGPLGVSLRQETLERIMTDPAMMEQAQALASRVASQQVGELAETPSLPASSEPEADHDGSGPGQ